MFIYSVTCKTDGKVYVGQTIDDVRWRWARHRYSARRNSPTYLHRAIRKYGEEVFVVSTLATASSHEELNELEREWIAKLCSNDPKCGYNLTEGGQSAGTTTGKKHSDATRAQMSLSHKTRAANTAGLTLEEYERRKAHPTIRQPGHSPETRAKISARMRGRKFSDEWRQKISASHTGKQRSEEHCRNISLGQIGKSRPRKKVV